MRRLLGLGLTLALAAGLLGAAACGDDDEDGGAATAPASASPTKAAAAAGITIEGAWARNSPAGMMPGGMMNPGTGMTPGGGMMTPGTGMTPGGGMMTPGSGMTPGGGMMTPGSGMAPGGMGSGDRGAAYMIIKNSGDADDALIAASSTLAEATEVHESRMDGDVATMVKVDRVAIPAGGATELKPGGFHIMFIGLKQPLKAGTTVTFDLEFEKAGTITVTAEVRES